MIYVYYSKKEEKLSNVNLDQLLPSIDTAYNIESNENIIFKYKNLIAIIKQ